VSKQIRSNNPELEAPDTKEKNIENNFPSLCNLRKSNAVITSLWLRLLRGSKGRINKTHVSQTFT